MRLRALGAAATDLSDPKSGVAFYRQLNGTTAGVHDMYANDPAFAHPERYLHG
jgi:hypothetical protein